MAAPRALEHSALKPQMQPERKNLNVDAITELLRFPDVDESGGDRLDFRSVEELVAHFDEKLNACFGNFESKAELLDDVNPLTEGTVLKNDQ